METILLIDKPKGITSFDVIRRLQREFNIKKIGHAGTLDPLASGLLIVGVGEGTKKLNEYLKLPKTYEVEILLGKSTTTGDLEGKVVEESEILFSNSHELENEVKEILMDLVKERVVSLPVPVYSAIKQDGEPLYKKARRGEKVNPPIKEMEIKRAVLRKVMRDGKYVVFDIEMEVGSGTYIRSIAEEIGKRLGYPAVVKELRRTKIGDFDVTDARKI